MYNKEIWLAYAPIKNCLQVVFASSLVKLTWSQNPGSAGRLTLSKRRMKLKFCHDHYLKRNN